ncbi:CocE/NonD family hydrolase [candidate division KSB1 bacterium]|nr:CocE/NonD family hydrolase [candidate division KSB1 bacterium]RQW04174.1 MAG: CocE/NonD family hydrolase [candidate division KSB1 bacterium]
MRRRILASCSFFLLVVLFSNVSFAESEPLVKMTRISVDDSTQLATDIYLPDADGPFPCILIRTPYNKDGQKGEGEKFTQLGYAVVVQDTRGKFKSDGTFYPFRHERADGLVTVEWIRVQSWSNGKIAGWGGSYVGYTQLVIADELDAMVPVVTTANMYEALYPAGLFSLATAFNWGLMVDSQTSNPIPTEKIVAAYSILPLSVADDSTYKQNDFLDDWLRHQHYDAYWQSMDFRHLEPCPAYSVAGWWDIFLMSQIHDFVKKRHPASRLIIGPYAHGKITIETEYGEHANLYKNEAEIIRFLDDQLKGRSQPEDKPYSLFIMQRNEWIECEQWPPTNSTPTPFYFHHNGLLSTVQDNEQKVYDYTYDPLNPFISLGGTFLGVGVGPAWQNPNAERKDQIVFESEPLAEPVVLLGPINATLYVSSDAPNTDFFVSLQEIRSDGQIINIQEGGATIEPGEKPERLQISLWATGYEVISGHRLRVCVISSLFPRYNRSLNSGETIFAGRTPRIAQQQLFVGGEYPSQVLLPIFAIK